jgi:hypothetical protein
MTRVTFGDVERIDIPSRGNTDNHGDLYHSGDGLLHIYPTETLYLDRPLVEELVARLQHWLDAGSLTLPEAS